MQIRISLREGDDGRWTASAGDGIGLRAAGRTSEACLRNVRRALRKAGIAAGGSGPSVLVVEVLPRLAGVAEAAQVLGWDKRRVATYIDRGRFPQPIQTLASGRVWRRSDIEAFARSWRERRARRGSPARPGPGAAAAHPRGATSS